jgi:hypothetical protein
MLLRYKMIKVEVIITLQATEYQGVGLASFALFLVKIVLH